MNLSNRNHGGNRRASAARRISQKERNHPMPPHAVYRKPLQMALAELTLMEDQIEQLKRKAASLMKAHQDAVLRVAEIPGFGADSAHQMIAEIGAKTAAFDSPNSCPRGWASVPVTTRARGNPRARSPKGSKHMWRLLNQAAHAAVKVKGSIFELTFCRLRSRMN